MRFPTFMPKVHLLLNYTSDKPIIMSTRDNYSKFSKCSAIDSSKNLKNIVEQGLICVLGHQTLHMISLP